LLRENLRVAGVAAIVTIGTRRLHRFKNLQKDPEYWRSLEAADSIEWKKLLQTASAKKNDFLAALTRDPNFAEYRSTISQNVSNAAARGIGKVDVEDRFDNVGQSALYKSLWPLLSADAHNNTSLLHSRHARTQGDAFVLELYSGRGAFGSSGLLTLAEMLMYTSEDIHETYGFGKGMVSEIRAIVDPLRAAAEEADKTEISPTKRLTVPARLVAACSRGGLFIFEPLIPRDRSPPKPGALTRDRELYEH
jgi:hypothetical protein